MTETSTAAAPAVIWLGDTMGNYECNTEPPWQASLGFDAGPPGCYADPWTTEDTYAAIGCLVLIAAWVALVLGGGVLLGRGIAWALGRVEGSDEEGEDRMSDEAFERVLSALNGDAESGEDVLRQIRLVPEAYEASGDDIERIAKLCRSLRSGSVATALLDYVDEDEETAYRAALGFNPWPAVKKAAEEYE